MTAHHAPTGTTSEHAADDTGSQTLGQQEARCRDVHPETLIGLLRTTLPNTQGDISVGELERRLQTLVSRSEAFAELERTHHAEHRELQRLRALLQRPEIRLVRRLAALGRFGLRLLRLVLRGLRRPRRSLRRLRDLYRTWRRLGWRHVAERLRPAHDAPASYGDWAEQHTRLDRVALEDISDRLATMAERPCIGLLMPTYNTPPQFLNAAVESVRAQLYPHWQLCIADDASTDPETRQALAAIEALDDSRIRIHWRTENGHISMASNSALALCDAPWIGLLDHDDLLAPDALFQVATTIEGHPDAGLIYSDEDKVDERGVRYAPYFKPDWNPDLLRTQNYLCHFSVYRASVLRAAGGFRAGLEGSQDYDLALRVTERLRPTQIQHIPRVLYHWRAIPGSAAASSTAKGYAGQAARQALRDHLDRCGLPDALVEPAPEHRGSWRIIYPVPEPAPLVSVIMPTRNGIELLRRAVSTLLERTDYPALELVIVDNGSDDPAAVTYLDALQASGQAIVLRDAAPFNFSALNNRAVAEAASGEVLCLLNNDVEIVHAEWLRELVGHALRPGTGVVGARLWYPNDTLQHGGCIIGVGGVAGHAFPQLERGRVAAFGRAVLQQNYSAVTAACLAVRREVFEAVGGLDAEGLKVAFNDIDFCLRVREAGYWNVWTPYSELYHHESATRGLDLHGEKRARFMREVGVMQQRWGEKLQRDPAYNPNLSLTDGNFRLADSPRLPAPQALDQRPLWAELHDATVTFPGATTAAGAVQE